MMNKTTENQARMRRLELVQVPFGGMASCTKLGTNASMGAYRGGDAWSTP